MNDPLVLLIMVLFGASILFFLWMVIIWLRQIMSRPHTLPMNEKDKDAEAWLETQRYKHKFNSIYDPAISDEPYSCNFEDEAEEYDWASEITCPKVNNK